MTVTIDGPKRFASYGINNKPFGEGTKKTRLLRAINVHSVTGGLTCDEAETLFGWSHQSCSPIFTRLKEEGLIKPVIDKTTNKPLQRKTRYNTKAIAWQRA